MIESAPACRVVPTRHGDRYATTFTGPTRHEAEEEAYRTYLHDTADAAYTLLGILMGSASSKDRAGGANCLQWNGHGSMRPCVGHYNVFKKNGCMDVGAEGAEGAARG